MRRSRKLPTPPSLAQILLRQKAAAARKSEFNSDMRERDSGYRVSGETQVVPDDTLAKPDRNYVGGSEEGRVAIDLVDRARLPMRGLALGEKDPEYCLIDFTAASDYLTMEHNVRGEPPRRRAGTPIWRVLVVILLASIVSLIPALRRQPIL